MDEENMWWEQFTKRYPWALEHEEGVKRGWRTILKRRLSGIMSDHRKKNKKPKWVSDTDWYRLKTYWATPEFKAKSKQSSINRKEGRGGKGPMTHMGGSLRHIEHHQRLEKKTGHSIPFPDSYDWCHQHHAGPKKGEYVDDDSRDLSGVFHSVYDNATTQATQAGQPHPDLPTQIALASEALGKLKKGRVQGLGSFSDVVKSMMGGSQSVSHSEMEQKIPKMNEN